MFNSMSTSQVTEAEGQEVLWIVFMQVNESPSIVRRSSLEFRICSGLALIKIAEVTSCLVTGLLEMRWAYFETS